MPDKRLNAGSIIEPLLVILSIIVYVMARAYPNMQPFASIPEAAALALQVALGLSLIFMGSAILDFYGRSIRNERDVRDTTQVFRLIAYPILVLVLLHTLNISIGSLLVGAGFLGIIIGLAAQTSLGNVFAGISIIYARPFAVGDKITFIPMYTGSQPPTYPHDVLMTSITGTVKRIGIVYTRLLRDDMSLIYIPNAALNQGYVQNHSRMDEKMVRIRLDSSRDIDIESFRKRLVSRLKKENEQEYDKLMALEAKLSLMSTPDSIGIIITARVKILDYDRLSQWLLENSIKALNGSKKGSPRQD
ncbi:MAG: mechanosensitive ion channel [Candidatus Micrarchaeota archaeon]|nr:mechanosensitive ion channel [Candidatus Micrarchaeota archaeon]